MIQNVYDLASAIGISTEENGNPLPRKDIERYLERSIYKYTDCGAWIKFEDDRILLGSIVEGIDWEMQPRILEYPFTSEDLDNAIQSVEDEAQEWWDMTHGCEDCGDENEYGYITINPDCKTCKGEGVVF